NAGRGILFQILKYQFGDERSLGRAWGTVDNEKVRSPQSSFHGLLFRVVEFRLKERRCLNRLRWLRSFRVNQERRKILPKSTVIGDNVESFFLSLKCSPGRP